MKFHEDGTLPSGQQVFVFGSNLQGIHGAGSAKVARLAYSAKIGIGEGLTGRAYAIPTRRRVGPKQFATLSLVHVQLGVERFLRFARKNPDREFFVTRIGCGLAGFEDAQIAAMFRGASENCSLPDTWAEYLKE